MARTEENANDSAIAVLAEWIEKTAAQLKDDDPGTIKVTTTDDGGNVHDVETIVVSEEDTASLESLAEKIIDAAARDAKPI
jgi:hypothetical protein